MKKIRYLLALPSAVIGAVIVLLIFAFRFVGFLLVYPLALFLAIGRVISQGEWVYSEVIYRYKSEFNFRTLSKE